MPIKRQQKKASSSLYFLIATLFYNTIIFYSLPTQITILMVMESPLVTSISKKIIKPSAPTPLSLKSHKLSLLDQMFHISVPIAFFYPKKSGDNNYNKLSYELVEKSLSKALTSYYPYAGRLKNGSCDVDCNDMGVELSNVHVHCPMSQIFEHPYTDAEDLVFPVAQPHDHNSKGYLAVAQVTHFDCGGIAIGGCLSHKIGDGRTASNFFYDWGLLSRDISTTLSPHFVGDSIYPQCMNNDPRVVSAIKPKERKTYIGKRFLFPAAKLNALKSIAAGESGVQNPTRTEVVTALLYKCAVAARRENTGSFKPSALFQMANMRSRLNPPLSEDACGGLISGFIVKTTNERDVNYPSMIREMRKEKEKLKLDDGENNAVISEVVNAVEEGNMTLHSNEFDDYFCSSLLPFPLYKTDFGWGCPARVSFATGPSSRFFYLMDNQNGVEATVLLGEEDMSLFETNPELLEFTIPMTAPLS